MEVYGVQYPEVPPTRQETLHRLSLRLIPYLIRYWEWKRNVLCSPSRASWHGSNANADPSFETWILIVPQFYIIWILVHRLITRSFSCWSESQIPSTTLWTKCSPSAWSARKWLNWQKTIFSFMRHLRSVPCREESWFSTRLILVYDLSTPFCQSLGTCHYVPVLLAFAVNHRSRRNLAKNTLYWSYLIKPEAINAMAD